MSDVVAFPGAGEALASLGGSPGAGVVVLVGLGGAPVRVATMTAFGPSVWTSPKAGPDVAASVLADARRRGRAAFLHVADDATATLVIASTRKAGVSVTAARGGVDDDADAAVASFLRRRADPPVSRTVEGVPMTGSWSVCPYVPGIDVVPGDLLALDVEGLGETSVLRWRHLASGSDAGIHAVLPRPSPSPGELRVISQARAEVTRMTYGMARLRDGTEARTNVLVLDVPMALETAFPDATRPRHGIFGEGR